MEQKIFLLIAIFCIAQVKSEEVEPEEYEDDKDHTDSSTPAYPAETGFPFPGFFPEHVLLPVGSSLWEDYDSKRKCFQEQYINGSDYYKQAIDDFSEDILKAVSETLEKVKEKSNSEPEFETLSQKIPKSAKELGDLFKQYREKFSGLVGEGSFDKMKSLMKEYEDKILEVEKTLDEDIRKLKGIAKTVDENSYNAVKNLESTRNSNLTDLTDAGKQVMELLELCMKEKNCKK